MVSPPLDFIDSRLRYMDALRSPCSPFPDIPESYIGFLGNLASSYTNGEVQMPTRIFYVTLGPDDEMFDHVIFQEDFREATAGSSIVVDHFTIQSNLYGTFYLTHLREFHHDNATICTIRRNLTAQSAWVPVRREFRYHFDFQEWLGSRWEWWFIDIGHPSTTTSDNLITVFADGYQYWVHEQKHRYEREKTLLILRTFLNETVCVYSCLSNPADPLQICWYNLP